MASYNNHHHDQPGLEVVPEPEAPQVVEQPHHWHKPTDAPYGTTPSSAFPGSDHGYGQYQDQNGYYNASPSTAADLEKRGDKRILGLPKKKFLLIFGALAALLIIGLAVGLGVGLGTKSNSSDSASATPSVSAAPIPIACPAADQTVYTASGGAKFNVTCGIDYGSTDGSADLGEGKAQATMEDCINSCVATSKCVGAGYGDFGTGVLTCFQKSRLGKGHGAVSGWLFAAKQS